MIATGNKIQFETDYVGKGEFPLSIQRTYNKDWRGEGLFGKNWITNYGHKLTYVYSTSSSCEIDSSVLPSESCVESGDGSKTPTAIIANKPDGVKILFTYQQGTGQWVDNTVETSRHIKEVAGGWEYANDAGYIEKYDDLGKILVRSNPRDISHTFTYSGSNLTKVTHSSGRYLNFSYTNGSLTRIIDSANNNYDYQYQYQRLSKATLPGTPSVVKDYTYSGGLLSGVSYNGNRYSFFYYDSADKGYETVHFGGG